MAAVVHPFPKKTRQDVVLKLRREREAEERKQRSMRAYRQHELVVVAFVCALSVLVGLLVVVAASA
jgi:hypothetical protein